LGRAGLPVGKIFLVLVPAVDLAKGVLEDFAKIVFLVLPVGKMFGFLIAIVIS
jgi:hypothetical protein